jgi:hypothetical protein
MYITLEGKNDLELGKSRLQLEGLLLVSVSIPAREPMTSSHVLIISRVNNTGTLCASTFSTKFRINAIFGNIRKKELNMIGIHAFHSETS